MKNTKIITSKTPEGRSVTIRVQVFFFFLKKVSSVLDRRSVTYDPTDHRIADILKERFIHTVNGTS